jgi:hypothetical protein
VPELLALALFLALAATPPARAQTEANIHVTLRPDRPGALAALSLHIAYGDSESSLPSPVRRAVLQMPQALGIEIPRLRSCSPARLRAHGPRACPPQSRLGEGSALVEAHLGSQTLSERVTLTAFLGPLAGLLQPTFEILARGYTPFDKRVVIRGTVVPDSPPYGEDLVISVPPIVTLPLEPDASIVSLSLAIGPRPGTRARGANAVLVPSRCPPGGLPFAVRSSFADGSSSTAATALPCT